ncbi:MAG: hypothetical protein ACT6RD_03470 [Brevundimonas sp.]|uniref:hypothetical protein n=1 Tax=Brevundimonas sp. TaxID=1871086 RepID=UPI004034D7BA
MVSKPPSDTVANWRTWVARAIARGPAEAARCARFLDALPSTHPGLKGVPPDLRAEWSDDLWRASRATGA